MRRRSSSTAAPTAASSPYRASTSPARATPPGPTASLTRASRPSTSTPIPSPVASSVGRERCRPTSLSSPTWMSLPNASASTRSNCGGGISYMEVRSSQAACPDSSCAPTRPLTLPSARPATTTPSRRTSDAVSRSPTRTRGRVCRRQRSRSGPTARCSCTPRCSSRARAPTLHSLRSSAKRLAWTPASSRCRRGTPTTGRSTPASARAASPEWRDRLHTRQPSAPRQDYSSSQRACSAGPPSASRYPVTS